MTVVIIFRLRKSPPNYYLLHKRHVLLYIALVTNQWCYQYAPGKIGYIVLLNQYYLWWIYVYLLDICLKYIYLFIEIPPPPNPLDYCECWKHFVSWLMIRLKKFVWYVRLIVFNATFNTISVLSWWRSVLLVEETDKHYHIMLFTPDQWW
jgi:hypothetical protein